MVAKGSYGATLNRTSKIWDNVAQQIILEEAGCTYTDFFGKPIDYSNPVSKARDNFTFCAAPPNLHQALQTLIHKVH
jgi:myo-inositol-1(or 4)-monophosphatase